MINIPELRRNAWNTANSAINCLNKLNSVLYQDMVYVPESNPQLEIEDKSNISLKYIKSLNSIASSYLQKLEISSSMFDYINNKHIECHEKYVRLKD